ncbi:purple acid phosphatase family protein [Anaerovorax odorimutans]|uniref:purple acid phosphatase family protein n=1 Tax=Anaerovorax odorimutans TaxID=109327 RepID=UPI0003F74B86|nr:metallophosphoesterase family protein [Anaerovorax odorimutans]
MNKKKSLLKRLTAVSIVFILLMALSGITAMADNTSLPDQVALSWTASPQTTQTVSWRAKASEGKVQYMKESEKTDNFSGAMEKAAQSSTLYDEYYHFEVQLDNLEPRTAYVYRVGNGSLWSKTFSFETEALSTEKFTFMDLGDVQEGEDTSEFKKLLEHAYTNYPDIKFSLANGDLIDDPTSSKQWEKFYEAAEGTFDHIPLFTAFGNHESEDNALYYKSMVLPQNGPEGYKEQFYSFDYGNAHFVVLNSNAMGNSVQCQPLLDWLSSDLEQSNKKWKFAVFHHPPYGVNSGNSGDKERAAMIQEKWLPILEDNGVDMVFVGHQHMYMRTYPIKNGKIQENQADGITYVMENSTDKYYVNPETHDYIQKVYYGSEEGTNIYGIISIDGDMLKLTSLNSDGVIKDEYVINKGKTMDSRVAVSSVKLLDNSFNEINSVASKGNFKIKVHLNNNSSSSQKVQTVVQVRCGDGASSTCGGKILGVVSVNADVPTDGADAYAQFTLPDISEGTAFVDVFVLDEGNVPIDMPYHKFNFTVSGD